METDHKQHMGRRHQHFQESVVLAGRLVEHSRLATEQCSRRRYWDLLHQVQH